MQRPGFHWLRATSAAAAIVLISGCGAPREGTVDTSRPRADPIENQTKPSAVRAVASFANPIPEAENETVGIPPSPLGGPFGDGVPFDGYVPRPTPLADEPIEKMTDIALVGYLDKLVYDLNVDNGQLILARCTRGNAACGSSELAAMYIQPEMGMNQRDTSSITENGLVVARLINYDANQRQDRAFKIPASTRAWWVVHRKNNKLESLFIIRRYADTPNGASILRSKMAFYQCPNHPPGDASRPSMARWWDCGHPYAVSAVDVGHRSGAGSYLRFISSPAPVPELPQLGDTTMVTSDGVWITCSLGCCIAQ